MKVLQVEHLCYSYHLGKQVLRDITFELESGNLLGITGTNGSGKTTLCYCLSGIIPHYLGGIMEGKVLINGRDTKEIPLGVIAREVGIIFQDPNLQIMMPTVEDELAFGLENRGITPALIRERIYEAMELVGIIKLKDENPVHLSGGEKQLVAIAAALALEPEIIIFDESLSMLDEAAQNRIISVMERLNKIGKTLILVEHTPKALKLAKKILVMEDGKIIT
ncbi:MAG: energy-coupling factor ABC transporter ATP-binding protein [Tepidanaerobacteraceae bacterium]|nr:energy-coupling factor ABC transporter ATP-binding protein [Tepidanaerobacteraceae bacterium]